MVQEHDSEDNNVHNMTTTHRQAVNITCTYLYNEQRINLYSMSIKTNYTMTEIVPFIHNVCLLGPKGKQTWIQALFNNSAMVSAMCSTIFHTVKHQLHNITRSNQKLCMINGTTLQSEVRWTGIININGVKVMGTFKVFNSRGGWVFLLEKPLLMAFRLWRRHYQHTRWIDKCHT